MITIIKSKMASTRPDFKLASDQAHSEKDLKFVIIFRESLISGYKQKGAV